jgi:hypothetical protein
MHKSVMCLFESQPEAEYAVKELHKQGFRPDDISVLFPDTRGTLDFAHEHNTKAPEGAVAGVGVGGTLGGTLGLLVGLGALAIPGFGPFLAAGPVMAALAGAAGGAAIGGVAGALIGMGIPEIEAKRYAGKLKNGNIWLSVHAYDHDAVMVAEGVLTKAGASDVCSTDLAVVPPHEAGPTVVSIESVA